ncbi:glycosyltransferase family 39 protein [Pelagibacteraceae bacterium]|nr:glycosyltransferase family 39 protein [Pelagibacteraceae bacterium]
MFKNVFTKNYFLIFIFFFLIFGSTLVKNYGFAWDNGIHRLMGFVNLKYIVKIFNPNIEKEIPRIKNIPNYSDHPTYKLYGSLFTLPTAIIETMLGITTDNKLNDNNEKVYYLSSYIIFFIYCISLLVLNKTLVFLTNNKIISTLSTLLLMTTPRIFAESFYNVSDIFLLCLVIFTNYFFLKYLYKSKLKNFILSSLFCSFCIITKISAGFIALTFIFTLLFVFVKNEITFRDFIKKSFIFFLIITIFYILFFPYMWSDPFFHFIELIETMVNYGWHGNILFFGNLIKANNTPWYYQITMFFLTIPISYLVVFLSLFIFQCFFLIKNKITMDKFFIYIFLSLILIFIASAALQNTKYNGWRHIYFSYPYFITVIGYMSAKIFKINFLKRFFYIFIFFLSFLIIQNLYWIIKYHPNQYAFFNSMMKNYDEKFDIDWWGMSNKEIINFLDKYDGREKIYIYSEGPSLNATLIRFNKTVKNKIETTNNLNQANYIISNYLDYKRDYKIKFNKVYEIKTNNAIISTIYQIN